MSLLTIFGLVDFMELSLQLSHDDPFVLVASTGKSLHPGLHALLVLSSEDVRAIAVEGDLKAVVLHLIG